jgi:putative chitinase
MNPIQEFQRKNNLVADGVIGKKTLQMMMFIFRKSETDVANMMGQGEIESGNWKKMREDMDYRSETLQRVFKKYFPTVALANKYAHNPEMIANYVYDDARRDAQHKLGNTQVGDGWKFRGNACGITGRNNHFLFSKYVKDPEIMNNPDLVWQKYFFESLLWYFDNRKIWRFTKDVLDGSIEKITKLIQGGDEGLEKRKIATLKYYKMLK